ncbi:MAG: DUF1566 domain-containing protein [Candidatus Electrothrix sp. MAN1_4]|nr:DUF1566 domain-containing protein [Candidatus Electrothrix sp. MAN1_4]
MKKIILVAGLVAGGVALSGTAFANHWLLYLPAILAGSGGSTEPPTTTETNNWLLFLPAILAGGQGGTEPPVVTDTSLNDTGITATVGSTGKEDANYGRDADSDTNNDDDGHKGFSFTKLDTDGNVLPDQTQTYATNSWACVQDNVTGLVWEVKTDDEGLHDRDYKYTWYNSDPAVNGGSVGTESENFDTESYVANVNSAGLCGKTSGWRLPNVKELLSIVSYSGDHAESIDTGYFPNVQAAKYWTGTHQHFSDGSPVAWAVTFGLGQLQINNYKSVARYVRLVWAAD